MSNETIKLMSILKNIEDEDYLDNYLDRTYGYQVLNGTKKPSRDKILQLCIGGSFSLKETNKVLKLGNCGELYSKNTRDAVIILGINKKLNVLQINELLFTRELDCLN